MGLLKKFVEGFKGDKEYQEGKARRKAKRAAKKAAKKPVSVEKTKGGDYPVYKKESRKAESFRSKFAKASKAGKKTFKWKGRSYTTEKAAAKPKKAALKKVSKPIGQSYEKVEKPIGQSYEKVEAKAPSEPASKKVASEKDVGGKHAWKAPEDKYRTKKQLGGQVESTTSPSYEEGGKVESNPYGWPSRDARGKSK